MNPTIPSSLEAAIQQYFDILYTCDLAKFDALFSAAAQLQTVRDGSLVVIGRNDYRALLAQRTPPASVGAARHDRVLHVDVQGDHCAMAKVGVSIIDKEFVDYLCFLQADGRWQLVSKVYMQTA
ncbi:nuclear transport factor 2 family protein [Variovorax sp. VNK109]|uniref:nuclear transport factor 2 family protein n=1 Tax=Variovorax sp. VNK109 TaxID=3400919 RepID=UPI003C0C648E